MMFIWIVTTKASQSWGTLPLPTVRPPPTPPPATLTTTVRRPRSCAARIAAWTAASSVVSPTTAIVSGPISLASSSAGSATRSKITTFIPASTRRRTLAEPRPPAPPVTIAERPAISMRAASSLVAWFWWPGFVARCGVSVARKSGPSPIATLHCRPHPTSWPHWGTRPMTEVMQGIRILEVAEQTFVPAASAILAEWGADVIKIEHVERGDAMRGLMASGIMNLQSNVHVILEHSNRGKRSLGLDLTSDEGRAVLYQLAATSDVFLTNKLPSVRTKLQLDVDDIRAANPDIVY